MRLFALSRHPAFRPGFKLTVGLWAFGYIFLELVIIGADDWRPNFSLFTSWLQFGSAIGCGALMLLVALAAQSAPRWKRMAMVGAVFLVLLLAQTFIDMSSNWMFGRWVDANMRPWARFEWDKYFTSLFIYFWVFGVNLVLIYLSIAATEMRSQRQEIAEARAAAAQAQLAMLRYQLNPHFLFNTLNAISSLVVTGRNGQAEDMLGRLSSFLRASLASEPNDYVRLDAELDVIQEYLDIEGVRFGERLRVDFACDAAAAPMLVPGFLLQPLVENAIKYAIGPARRPVTIKIDARLDGEDLVVMVCDDGDGSAAGQNGGTRSGTGTGLRNVRARLEALYGSRGVLEAVPLDQGFLAIVRLPARLSMGKPVLVEAKAAVAA